MLATGGILVKRENTGYRGFWGGYKSGGLLTWTKNVMRQQKVIKATVKLFPLL
jgi:predicted membrane chloride channel (bestrophin family)